MNSFYTEKELNDLGFKYLGKNVLLSRKCSVYGAGSIEIGDNTRIDDFCILSGRIRIGKYVHIAAYVGLFAGSAGIVLEDFVGVSSRSVVYAASDDYSGDVMTNPTIPDIYRNVIEKKTVFEKHALVGTGCTILPGASIGEGTAVGAMSLVNKPLDAWGIYMGIPCKRVSNRNKKILALDQKFEAENSGSKSYSED